MNFLFTVLSLSTLVHSAALSEDLQKTISKYKAVVPSVFINNLREAERVFNLTPEHLVVKAHFDKAKKSGVYLWSRIWTKVFNSLLEKNYFDGFGERGVLAGRFAFMQRFFKNPLENSYQNHEEYLRTLNEALKSSELI